MLKSFDGKDGGLIEFERNPYYSGKYDVPGEKMTWHINLDNASRINSIAEKNSLVVEAVPELDVEKLDSAGVKVDFVQGFGCAYLMFNTLKAPFNDKRVRQAFHYAINKQKLIESKLDGHASSSSSLLPSGHPNYNKATNVYEFNEEKAKSLLREAGITSLNCSLTVDSNWVNNLSSQILSDLKNVGINAQLDLKTINWTDYAMSKKVLPFDVILAPGDPAQLGNDADLIMSF